MSGPAPTGRGCFRKSSTTALMGGAASMTGLRASGVPSKVARAMSASFGSLPQMAPLGQDATVQARLPEKLFTAGAAPALNGLRVPFRK